MDRQNGNEQAYVALTLLLLLASAFYGHGGDNWRRVRAALPLVLIAFVSLTILVVSSLAAVRYLKIRSAKLRPDAWDGMSGRKFEDQIVIWLQKSGYTRVVKTEYFDQGIDIIAAKEGLLTGVQVKRTSRPVGVAAIRAAVAGISSYGCARAMVVTNASFTAAAMRLAVANNCQLIDGRALKSRFYTHRLMLN